MKKICLVFVTAVLWTVGAHARSACEWVMWEPGRNAKHNDYIWWDAREFQDANSGGEGKSVICGGTKKNTCYQGDKITAPAGHVFNGTVMTHPQEYECVMEGYTVFDLDAKWKPLGVHADQCNFRFQGANVTLDLGDTYPTSGGMTISKGECQKITGETLTGTNFKIKCEENQRLHCIALDPPEPPKPTGCTANIKGSTITINKGGELNIDLSAEECQGASSASGITGTTQTTNGENSSVWQRVKDIANGWGGGTSGTSTSNPNATDANAIYHFFCGPGCRKVGCKDNYDLDSQGNCVRKSDSCRQQRAGMGEEAKACCDTGSAGSWDEVIPRRCVCIVEGSNPKVKDPNKEFQIIGGRGRCVPKSGPIQRQCPSDATPSGSTCTCTDLLKRFDEGLWACITKCPADATPNGNTCACNDLSKRFDEGLRVCVPMNCPSDATLSGTTCVCYDHNMTYSESTKLCECTVIPNTTKEGNKCVCTEPHRVLKNGKCKVSEEYLGKLKVDITKVFSKISPMMGSFEKSVWKNNEGEFNTARLASDGIAGVVLGTVGGVITAKVVRKNQLKQGFEDIKCSIGGQNFANYGDDFTVGY